MAGGSPGWSVAAFTHGIDNVFYRIMFARGIGLLGASHGKILRSADAGSHWFEATADGDDDILAFTTSESGTTVTFIAGGFGGGIRVSSDSGSNWLFANTGLGNLNVTSLVRGSRRPDSSGQIIVAGTYGGGIYVSEDNGLSWDAKNAGLTGLLINDIATLDDTIVVARSGGKVSRSTDQGESWQDVGSGLPDTEVLSAALVQCGDETWVFAGTIDAGIWRCSAAGGSWSSVSDGLLNSRVNSILVQDTALFVATHQGVYRSVDYGTSWQLLAEETFPRVSLLHVAGNAGLAGTERLFAAAWGGYYAGPIGGESCTMFMTDDRGEHWTNARSRFFGPSVSMETHGDASFLCFGGNMDFYGGMYASFDNGETWELRSQACGGNHIYYCMSVRPWADGSGYSSYVAGDLPSRGLFFSNDTGRSWSQISTSRITALCALDSRVMIRDVAAKVWRTSRDSGMWEEITHTLSGVDPVAFTRDGERLFATVADDAADGQPGGLVMTTDAGAYWVAAGLEGSTVSSLVPVGDHLVAVADGRVYCATRADLLWVDVTANLPATSVGSATASADWCYALGSDGGSMSARPMSEIVQELATPPAPPDLLAPPDTATLSSHEVEFVWRKGTPAVTRYWLETSTDSAFLQSTADSMLVDTAVVRSGVPEGQYWWRVRAFSSAGWGPFSKTRTFTICVIAGTRWVRTNGPDSLEVRSLAVIGTNLFAGTTLGIFRSTNNGTTWTEANGESTHDGLRALAVLDTNLFAGMYYSGVYRSSDSGTTWTPATTGLTSPQFPIRLQTLVGSSTTLFAGSVELVCGVFRSTNNGASWDPVFTGVTYPPIQALAATDSIVYAGTRWVGILRSSNNGTDWTDDTSIFRHSAVYALAATGSALLAYTSAPGPPAVYRSTTSGADWEPVASLPGFNALAVGGRYLFAGSSSGVFRSLDSGVTWTAVNLGLTDIVVEALAVCGGNLFAGTRHSGVWRRQLPELVTPVEVVAGETPRGFVLHEGYPNPFNPTATITFELPATAIVRLSVYDLLGREVGVLVNARMEPGLHKITFDGSRLSSGVYLSVLRAGQYAGVKKLLLLR